VNVPGENEVVSAGLGPLGNLDERRLLLGGIAFPLVAPSTGGTLVTVGDPFLDVALPYWQHCLNHYLGAAYVAAMAGQASVVASNRACVETSVIDPAPFLGDRALRLPLLACFPMRGTCKHQSIEREAVQSTHRLLYILPALSWEQQKRIGCVMQAALKVLHLATEEQGVDSYQSGANVWDDAGTSEITFQTWQIGQLPNENAFTAHLALQVDILVRERSDYDETTGAPLWGMTIQLDVGDTGEGDLEDLVSAEQNL